MKVTRSRVLCGFLLLAMVGGIAGCGSGTTNTPAGPGPAPAGKFDSPRKKTAN